MVSRRNPLLLPRTLSRRTALKGAGAITLASGIPFTKLSIAAAQEDEEPTTGGTLNVAIVGEPPAVLDAMYSTATVTNNLSAQMYQSLFAFDSMFNPQPMLVEDYTLSDDSLTFSFQLRSGITFHNGQPLTSADVVASLNRWGAINGRGRQMFERLASIDAIDELSFEMVFDVPSGVLLSYLARADALITTADIAEAAGEDPFTEFIGTGPFMFEEHLVDQYIRMVRFDDYVPRDEEPDGLAGRRTAYVDQIDFIPVPDESVRANGVVSGDYHFGDPLPPDFLDTLEMDPMVDPVVVQPYYWYAPVFNKAQGLFTDQNARKAVQLAFSQSEALLAGFGREELIRADPSISGEETAWYSVAGADDYDQPDPERARALLEEAGYAGETIRWITTHEYAYNFNIADYVRQQLEAIDVDVELIVSDWATVVANRADPDAYDIFLTGFTQYNHPAAQPYNDANWPGFWDSELKDAAITALVEAADDDALSAAVDQYTEAFWTDMPAVKVGDNFVLRGISSDLVGYVNMPDWYFWNVGFR